MNKFIFKDKQKKKKKKICFSFLYLFSAMISSRFKCYLDPSDFHIYICSYLSWNPHSYIQLQTLYFFFEAHFEINIFETSDSLLTHEYVSSKQMEWFFCQEMSLSAQSLTLTFHYETSPKERLMGKNDPI